MLLLGKDLGTGGIAPKLL